MMQTSGNGAKKEWARAQCGPNYQNCGMQTPQINVAKSGTIKTMDAAKIEAWKRWDRAA